MGRIKVVIFFQPDSSLSLRMTANKKEDRSKTCLYKYKFHYHFSPPFIRRGGKTCIHARFDGVVIFSNPKTSFVDSCFRRNDLIIRETGLRPVSTNKNPLSFFHFLALTGWLTCNVRRGGNLLSEDIKKLILFGINIIIFFGNSKSCASCSWVSQNFCWTWL